jgi:hypothetical protein
MYYDLLGPAIGAILVSLAKADGEFFDYCAHVCGVNILAGIALPQSLKKFASDVLTGNASRPKKNVAVPAKKFGWKRSIFGDRHTNLSKIMICS